MNLELKVEDKLKEENISNLTQNSKEVTDEKIEKSLNYDVLTDEEKKAIDTLGVELVDEEKFMIEEDATRINLYFKKVKHTPSKYPRAYGQIKKKPLEG